MSELDLNIKDSCYREDTVAQKEKPPIGLVPKWVRDEARRVEILEAMMRYAYSHKNIPPEWIEELVQLSKIDRPSDIPVTVKIK